MDEAHLQEHLEWPEAFHLLEHLPPHKPQQSPRSWHQHFNLLDNPFPENQWELDLVDRTSTLHRASSGARNLLYGEMV